MKAPRHYKCVLCGREFVNPIPHKCAMGSLKRIHRAAKKRGLKSIFIKINERERRNEMKVYVYEDTSHELRQYTQEKNLSENPHLIKFVGIQEEVIEPVKKEVVKEINLGNNIYSVSSHFTTPTSAGVFNHDIPKDAYDRKLTYKVKE